MKKIKELARTNKNVKVSYFGRYDFPIVEVTVDGRVYVIKITKGKEDSILQDIERLLCGDKPVLNVKNRSLIEILRRAYKV